MPVSVVSAECWGGPWCGMLVDFAPCGGVIAVGHPEGQYRSFTVWRDGHLRYFWKWIEKS